jgi:HEPN domain-containing protein
MEEDIKYWVDLAKYDLDTAKAMLDTARYVYVLFMCQQALEKLLKAHVVKTTKSFPPRLHNLLRLLELSALSLSEENKKFLEKLSYYYLESRYPEEKKKISADVNRNLAQEYFLKTKELFKWLESKLI